MNDKDWQDYVRAGCRLHGLELDAGREAEAIMQLARIHELAKGLLAFQLPPEIEPAPVFRP